MTLTITSALALFVLIALSTVVFFAAKKFKLPYTVLLVLVGLIMVPVVNLPYFENIFGFLDDMVLTPELLFYIFLPVLIFESGFNMKVRKMIDSAWAISLLSIVSLVVSVLFIATSLFYLLPFIGIEMPFIVALLFGAIISPTDPVAVLSVFKECGVPRRLAMIFEGESLMNDGTAMALFLVLLSIISHGFNGTETVVHGVFSFVTMIIFGIIIGLAMAAVFSRALYFTKNNEFVTVTLLLISAHIVFITTELINQSGVIHVSSIIATTVAALFLGNYSRTILPPKLDEYLGKLVEHMAFVVNSLVFLMAGLLFASSGVKFNELWLPILITVLVVAMARVIAVYAVTKPLNLMKIETHIPDSWQKLLAWGSLRGALSIIIVLLIPENFTVEGWTYPHPPRDLLLALTIGCILATLFIKAPTIQALMRRLNISSTEPLKEAYEADLGIYYLLSEKTNLLSYKDKGFLKPEQFDELIVSVDHKLIEAKDKRDELVRHHGKDLFFQALHLSMIHAEKTALKKLFINEEVSEKTFRKVFSKLILQQDKIENAQHNSIDPRAYSDRKDIFDRLIKFLRNPLSFGKEHEVTIEEKLEYYRAQMIISRKAFQAIEHIQNDHGQNVFLTECYDNVVSRYVTYKENSEKKMNALVDENSEQLKPYLAKLAQRSLAASGIRALNYLHDNGLVDEEEEEDIRHKYAI